jgi:hypothetical protein
MYCRSAEDQQRLEAFIANSQEIEKPGERVEDRSDEFEFTISPDEFVLHPSRTDELYFETQKRGSNTCGIHALNHFVGKPIFGLKRIEIEGANILYKCFVEAPDLLAKLRSIRENLVTQRTAVRVPEVVANEVAPEGLEALEERIQTVVNAMPGLDDDTRANIQANARTKLHQLLAAERSQEEALEETLAAAQQEARIERALAAWIARQEGQVSEEAVAGRRLDLVSVADIIHRTVQNTELNQEAQGIAEETAMERFNQRWDGDPITRQSVIDETLNEAMKLAMRKNKSMLALMQNGATNFLNFINDHQQATFLAGIAISGLFPAVGTLVTASKILIATGMTYWMKDWFINTFVSVYKWAKENPYKFAAIAAVVIVAGVGAFLYFRPAMGLFAKANPMPTAASTAVPTAIPTAVPAITWGPAYNKTIHFSSPFPNQWHY